MMHLFLRDSLIRVIEYLQPGTVVKGKDFENEFNLEQEAVESYGGRLLFSSGGIRFSSLDLLKSMILRLSRISILMSHCTAKLGEKFLLIHQTAYENSENVTQIYAL